MRAILDRKTIANAKALQKSLKKPLTGHCVKCALDFRDCEEKWRCGKFVMQTCGNTPTRLTPAIYQRLFKAVLLSAFCLLPSAFASSLPYPAPAVPYGELENGDSIVVKMAGAKTTTEPTYYLAWVDTQETNYQPGNSKGSFNDTTEVTALATPASGMHRLAISITICNIDTVSQSVYVSVANASSRYYLLNAYALAPNATVTVTAGGAASSVPLAIPVTVPNGGTGQTTLTSGAFLVGNGASAVSLVGPGSTGQIAISNGTTQSMHSLSGDVTMDNLGAVTIGAAKVTDADLATSYIKADGTRAFTGSNSHGGFGITNVLDPVNAQDAATKNYVDSVSAGLEARDVKYATNAVLAAYAYNNGVLGVGATITETGFGALSVDGSTPAVLDRILVKNEVGANQPYNGIYTVTVIGTGITSFVLTRALDQDTAGEFAGVLAFVASGTANTQTAWICSAATPVTVGTTNIPWTQFQLQSGTAGGDLSGTYPNPTVAKINGVALGSTTATAANLLIASGTQWVTNAVTGDITIGSTGITAIGALKVTNAMIANGTIDLTGKVTGLLPLANGGTNANNTASNGGIPWSDASKVNILAGTATANKPLISGASASPAWAAYTIPTALAIGDVIYADTTSSLARLADVATGNVLHAGGVSTAPSYSAVSLTADVSGILPIANGGTGLSSYTAGDTTYWASGTALTKVAIGTQGRVWQSTGTAPAWANVIQYPATKSSAYPIVAADNMSFFRVTGTTTLTLPQGTATGVGAGFTVWIQNVDTGGLITSVASNLTNTDTINGNATTSGGTPLKLTQKYAMAGFVCNGGNPADWTVIDCSGDYITSGLVAVTGKNFNTAVNITSIVLTPGLWTVHANAVYVSGGTTPTLFAASVGTTSATLTGNVGDDESVIAEAALQTNCSVAIPGVNFLVTNVAGTQTIFLVGQVNAASGANIAISGRIMAERKR